MKPGITMGISNCFIQFMGHDVGHGISAFIPIRTEALGGATRSIGYGRAAGGRVSDKCNFYVSRTERAGSMKATVSSAKARGSCGQTHIRRGEKEINPVGIHGKSPVIKRLADGVRKGRVV